MLALPMPQPPHLYQCGQDIPPSKPPPNDVPSATLLKRPKLSLEISSTSTPRTFGKSTTALTLGTVCASPTVHNTYSNAYNAQGSRAPTRPSSSQRTLPPRRRNTYNNIAPYHQPHNVRGILRNSPLDRQLRSSTKSRAPPRRFPQAKKVTYATPLSEEIKTVEYVASHMDLLLAGEEGIIANLSDNATRGKASVPEPRHEELEGENTTTLETPSAPVVQRRRRQRDWVWTLESVVKTTTQ